MGLPVGTIPYFRRGIETRASEGGIPVGTPEAKEAIQRVIRNYKSGKTNFTLKTPRHAPQETPNEVE